MIKPELRLGYKEYESRIDNLFGLFFILLFLFQVLCLFVKQIWNVCYEICVFGLNQLNLKCLTNICICASI